ncbi:MAG: radical SAM protein, partial [Acidobacteriota bacterium]
MRVLLVNPYNVGKFGLQNVFQVEPLGLEHIGTHLQPQHDVYLLDLRWEKNFEAVLARFRPDVVGISCLYTSHIGATWDLATRTKTADANCLVVIGGQPPSLAPEYFFSPDIDVIVRGDGEDVMLAVCNAHEKGTGLGEIEGLVLNHADGQQTIGGLVKFETTRGRPVNRRLPGIDRKRHYLSFTRPLGLAEVTRGCPFQCEFCSIWKFGGASTRAHTIDRVLHDLSTIPEDSVFFADDHFFANPKFMRLLGEALVEANLGKTFNVQTRADVLAHYPDLIDIWKEAGLHAVFLGLEGHSDQRLKEVRKDTTRDLNERAVRMLSDRGVGVVGNIMVDPRFTRQEFTQVRRYVKDHGYHFAAYCISTPFPGTDLFERAKGEIETWDFELFDIQHAVTRTTLPLDDFYAEYADCWTQKNAMVPVEGTLVKLKRVVQA